MLVYSMLLIAVTPALLTRRKLDVTIRLDRSDTKLYTPDNAALGLHTHPILQIKMQLL